jgi:hypothetical protein
MKERSLIPMKMHPVGVKGLGSSNGRPFGHREIDIMHNILLSIGPKPKVFIIFTGAETVWIQPPQSTPLADVHLANSLRRNTVNLPTILTNFSLFFSNILRFNLSPIKLNTVRTSIVIIFITRGTSNLTLITRTTATNMASSLSQGSMGLHTAMSRRKGLLRIPRRHHSGLVLLQNRVPLLTSFMSLKAVNTVTCGEAKT